MFGRFWAWLFQCLWKANTLLKCQHAIGLSKSQHLGHSMQHVIVSEEEQEAYRLTAQNRQLGLEQFHRNGIVVLENAVSHASIDHIRERMLADLPRNLSSAKAHFNHGKEHGNLTQTPPLLPSYLHDDVWANQFAIQIIELIIGPNIQLSFATSNIALPNGKGRQAVHSDYYCAHLDLPVFLEACVYLSDVSPENGSTEVWLGTHEGYSKCDHSHEDMGWIKKSVFEEQAKMSPPFQPRIPKGSIVVRDLRMWHAGMPNRTEIPRIMLGFMFSPRWFGSHMRMRLPESASERVESWDNVEVMCEYAVDEGFDYLNFKQELNLTQEKLEGNHVRTIDEAHPQVYNLGPNQRVKNEAVLLFESFTIDEYLDTKPFKSCGPGFVLLPRTKLPRGSEGLVMSEGASSHTRGGSDSSWAGITPSSTFDVPLAEDISFTWEAVRLSLKGVAVAFKLSEHEVLKIEDLFLAQDLELQSTHSLQGWCNLIQPTAFQDASRQLASIAFATSFLRESGRLNILPSPADLDFIWSLVHVAFRNPLITATVSQTSQGNFTIPLHSIIKDGNIDELFRFHVWTPHGKRPNPDWAIHSHQPLGQSWLLAGASRDHTYDVRYVSTQLEASYSEFTVGWADPTSTSHNSSYRAHPKSSALADTGRLIRTTPFAPTENRRNGSYIVPAGVFHRTEVADDTLTATIFFFDAKRGFQSVAPVLGPVGMEPLPHQRDVVTTTSSDLADIVDATRRWEDLYEAGMKHVYAGEWEEAVRVLRSALHIVEIERGLKDATRYRYMVTWEIGHMLRMLGRYDAACDILEQAISQMPISAQKVEAIGELACVYRHMTRLEDCMRASQDEYDTASQLGLEKEMCRALGTLGMVNYQLYEKGKNIQNLNLAIIQLKERVALARKIQDDAILHETDATVKARVIEYARQREAIAHGRLSLCFIAKQDMERAVQSAYENHKIMLSQNDCTKIAFSKAFYGRALLLSGRREEALQLFNPPDGTCTPIIALCKEPSDEHRGYIQGMIDAGADLELRDEQGYSALDCAIYSGDTKTQEIIEEGLRQKWTRQIEGRVEHERYLASLRKGYRDLFQDQLRPVLLKTNKENTLAQLRETYSETLAKDEEKRRLFDKLKFVRYADFLAAGQLPRSSDKSAVDYIPGEESDGNRDFILFFSYRWIAKDAGSIPLDDSPDDINKTQYYRMIRAAEQFLELHTDVQRDNLCIWIDFACVDQMHQGPGVAALPMNLAQCDAMISLIDDQYYERSWCCVEVLMIQTLCKSYGRHLWYEHVIEDGTEWLREGPVDMRVDMKEKKVAFESDRPKLLFLERQTRLLS
ncbi:hypothetical protein BDV96DRAFT_594538 [Lophiotrema nucula]|uniref:Uncharacterized protein n=1 Tax=Lophiotrema nucula TaxID=690887 RepID=A0A6A5ZSR3_9PLEO|nr:hypothetical protein BDV96DRAFT_594538 [Lophiotrema nucula]